MKRLALSLAAIAIAGSSAWAQYTTTVPDLKAQVDKAKASITKSDAEINDAKKTALVKTWENRAKTFVTAYEINTKGVQAGYQAAPSETNPFACLQTSNGEPKEKKTEQIGNETYEVWVYPTINYYIKNNTVQFWKETYVADEKALDKATEAYKKAIELDDNTGKGTYKSKKTTIDAIASLHDLYFNDGVNQYQLKNNKKAAEDFEGALKAVTLVENCKPDSIIGQTAYYAGLTAYENGNKDKAEQSFKQSIDKKYQIGGSYHYLYQINMDKGQKQKAIELAKSAYEKYPNEEQILYDVINYYLSNQQNEEAEKYLDQAIQKYPQNKGLHTVKANMYVTAYRESQKKFEEEKHKADSLKKAAFRNRSNKTENDRLTAEQEKMNQKAEETRKEFFSGCKKAEDIYNKLISEDPKYYDAYFMLGMVYYDKSELAGKEKDMIPLSEDKDGSKAAAKEKEQKEAWRMSLNYFQKASEIQPTNKDALSNMRILYSKLGEYQKAKEIKERIEKL